MLSTLFIQVNACLTAITNQALTLFGIIVLISLCRRSKQVWPTVVASIFLGINTITWLSLFVGQVFVVYGNMDLARILIGINADSTAWSGPGMAAFAAWAYLGRRRKLWSALAMASAIPFTMMQIFLREPRITVDIQGMTFPASGLADYILALSPLFITNVFMGILALREWRRTGNLADKLMAIGGFYCLLIPVIGFILLQYKSGLTMSLFGIYYFFYFLFFVLGFIGIMHPDSQVRRNPFLFFRRSLKLKSLIFSMVLVLISISAILFISATIIVRDKEITSMGIERAFFSERTSDYLSLTSEVERAGSLLSGMLMGSSPEDWPGIIESWNGANRTVAAVRMQDGETIAPEVIDSASLRQMFDSWVESSGTVNLIQVDSFRWCLVLDIDLGDGLTWLSVTSPMNEDWFMSGFHGNKISFGMLSANGEDVFGYGREHDLSGVRTSLQSAGQSMWCSPDSLDDMVDLCVVPVFSHDGAVHGYLYSFVHRTDKDYEAISVVVLLAQIGILVGAIVFLLTVLAIVRLVRPVVVLGEAARQVEDGNYDVRIGSNSIDEIGTTTRAFNSMAESLRKRTAELDEKFREQKDLLNYVAHEIKTPVTAVRWALEMVKGKLSDSRDEETLLMVDEAMGASDRMRNLVNDLLEFARMERGAIAVKPAKIDILDAIDNAVTGLAQNCAANRISIDWHRPVGTMTAMADPNRLAQVLANVIGNAVKYSEPGGTVSVAVAGTGESMGRSGKFVRVTVRDSGIGIPEDQQAMIFSRFFRAVNAVESKREGTGLGMHFTKRLLEMQGGDIWFVSRPGEGTTFEFTLPVGE